MDNPDDDEGKCRTCGEPYDGCGDGFDGECPSCADKTFGDMKCEGRCGENNRNCTCYEPAT